MNSVSIASPSSRSSASRCSPGNEFLTSFESRFIDALITCAKTTFEMIKARANPAL